MHSNITIILLFYNKKNGQIGLNNILFKYNLYIHINDTSNTGFDSKINAYI